MRFASAAPRRLLVLLVTALLLTALAGCTDEPDGPPSPGIGNSTHAGDLEVLGAAVVTDGEGNGTLVGTVNSTRDEPDRLVELRASSEQGPVPVTLPAPVPIPPQESVRLHETADIRLSTEGLKPGRLIELHLEFAKAGEVGLKVPVERQEGAYADVEVPS
jgi:copper(I)-binding protein